MMKNWSHSGIDKEKLLMEFEEFKVAPFPEKPENDDIYDLYSELVELDGHIAGLVSSYLKGSKIDLKLLHADEAFNRLLVKYRENSSTEKELVMPYEEYKDKIDRLVSMIEHLENM